MTVDDGRAGSKPRADDWLRTLRAICEAARQADCSLCSALAPEECVYTSAPVSVPVTPGTPVRPVRGYHACRFERAADRGLITAADLEAVTAGLAPSAVVWDDGSPPRPAPAATPHQYIPPGPVEIAPYLGFCQPETRQAAFAAVLQGVDMGAHDVRIFDWLVGWDDPTCRTIASLMWRCRLAGTARLAGRLDGLRHLLAAVLADENRSRQLALEHAAVELADISATGPGPAAGVAVSSAEAGIICRALADAVAYQSARPGHSNAREQAAAYEALLRRLVTGQEA
jgi:hypothetical protein